MTILEYLYERYTCSNLDILEKKCPINLSDINLNNKMYVEFEKLLNDIEGVEYNKLTTGEIPQPFRYNGFEYFFFK